MWWNDETIEETITPVFIRSQLRNDERSRLDEPVGFGGGLTDDSYLDWIVEKAARIFLILVELGVPDQIFGVIDDSWDDDDLPIPQDQVDRLRLTIQRDEKLERKFFQRQFAYLLRPIEHGTHIDFEEDEYVPLQADRRSVIGLTHHDLDKVYLSGKPDDVFLRRGVRLGQEAGQMPREQFLTYIGRMQASAHKHMVTLWASYTHRGTGYVLLTPVSDGSLKSYLNMTPQSIKILSKHERCALFLNWLRCLVSALAFLHSRGIAHGRLRPSNIMFDANHRCFLSDIDPLREVTSSKGFDKEVYDFAAPETRIRSSSSPGPLPPMFGRFSSADATGLPSDRVSICTTSAQSLASNGSSQLPVDPFAADIFSVGCIFLEILSFLMKKSSRSFAAHRSAKNMTAGRGGGLPDASFYKNLSQVHSWMKTLAKDAGKKDDPLFRGVKPILDVVEKMLAPAGSHRPSAFEVMSAVDDALQNKSGLSAKDMCCSADSQDGINYSMAVLTLGTTPESYSCSPIEYRDALQSPSGTAGTFQSSRCSSDTWPLSPTQKNFSTHSRCLSTMTDDAISQAPLVPNVSPTTIDACAVSAIGTAAMSRPMSIKVGPSTITGNGREIKERRFAGGGGRTAKPRSKVNPNMQHKSKTWHNPISACECHASHGSREAVADVRIECKFEKSGYTCKNRS